MTCSCCGEKIEKGANYFEYYEPNENGSQRVILCEDCLNENMQVCDEDEEDEDVENQHLVYADIMLDELKGK